MRPKLHYISYTSKNRSRVCLQVSQYDGESPEEAYFRQQQDASFEASHRILNQIIEEVCHELFVAEVREGICKLSS